MRIFKSALLVAAAIIPATAHAEDSDTIIVSANRTQQTTSEVAQSVTVITLDDITTRQSVAVIDLLRSVPGITVTSNGGLGTSTSVSIRGADSDQTVALIDGVKLNDPSTPGGGFNFGNLLTGNIERIEVVRGSQSVLWGSQAIGGVVNIVTRTPTEAIAVNAAAEYGWRDTARVVGNVSGKFGPVSASVGAGYLRTDGFSTFNEARGGKERDGYRNFGANAKFSVALSDAISVDLRSWYSDGKVGIDGFPAPTFSFGDTPEFARTKELVGYAGLNAALLDGRFRNRFAYTLTDTRRRNIDLTGGAELETFNAKGRNERFEYQGNIDLIETVGATFGAETEKSSFRTSSYGSSFSHAEARINSVYGQLSAKPISGLTLSAGLRNDDHTIFGGKTTFSAGGVFTPNEGGTTLRASYGEGFKTPSLFQLFSEYGNTALVPESSQGWDAGVTQRLLDGKIEVGATWFHRDSRNLIAFISCTVPLTGICIGHANGTYDNVAKARAQGLEFALTLKPVEALRVQANYGYVDATNVATGRDLARRPRHSVNTSLDYDWAFGLKTGATITHVGASFDNASNTRKLSGYVLVDLRAAFPVTRHIELYGRIENLLNEQYETSFRYGTPRRAAYAGVRLAI
ncbi:vitamin B12 transporter [Novosphingobium hassiacum]|uniref:Vitamin B12 transporter n=1 Tax=Novosphingobium hassiacum TaxID=173676 RepID=A0A7W6EUX4_9SPHN|nr:TonB-dependent receptor [Novosphingobium hassiacum]MBB3859591.1 vitamin B12 transporter [Novosphingobium hassiacum]